MMDKLAWVLAVAGVLFCVFGWLRDVRAHKSFVRDSRAEVELAQKMWADTTASFDAYVQQEMREKARLLEYKRKADEYLAKIEEVITERETWRALYNDQAGGHDNAQALMLDAINKLLHVYRRDTGKSPQLDPMIELVRGEWVSVHGDEARENLGSDGKPKDSDRKPA